MGHGGLPKNGAVLWSHGDGLPIGLAEIESIDDTGVITALVKVGRGELPDKVLDLAAQGVLRGVSIGLRRFGKSPRAELREISLVPAGVDPDSLVARRPKPGAR